MAVQLGKWLPILVEQSLEDPDFNDSDEVLGWLGAVLVGDVLTVTYQPDSNHDETVERYRVVPTRDQM